jgi:hypothetical protein
MCQCFTMNDAYGPPRDESKLKRRSGHLMSSSVAPLALSHALRRWIHNAPQDQQTLASAIETLRADETDEAVDLLTSTLICSTLPRCGGCRASTPRRLLFRTVVACLPSSGRTTGLFAGPAGS